MKECKIETFSALIADHIPGSKLSFEVEDSTAELKVSDYDGTGNNDKAWTEIVVSEVYRLQGSKRFNAKTIHITLNPEQRKKLIEMLTKEV